MASDDAPLAADVLTSWLATVLDRDLDPAATVITRPTGGGWSNDTIFVDLHPAGRSTDTDTGTGPGTDRRVVVRMAPSGPTMFPDYDLARQCRVMQALAAAGAVPVPPVLATDLDGTALGRPAFVMGFVPGRVPSDDRPSFAEAGFLVDASPGDQRRFHLGLIDALVSVHAVAVTPELADVLGHDASPPAHRALATLQRWWEFDRGERWPPSVDQGLARLASGPPPAGPELLLWGDGRPANVIVAADRFDPVALLDWELSTIGAPELDLTWMAEMNRFRMEGSGVARLPGFLTDDEANRHYGERTGRELPDLDWYRLLSAVKIAILLHRLLRVTVHVGRLPADHRALSDTAAARRVTELLR